MFDSIESAWDPECYGLQDRDIDLFMTDRARGSSREVTPPSFYFGELWFGLLARDIRILAMISLGLGARFR